MMVETAVFRIFHERQPRQATALDETAPEAAVPQSSPPAPPPPPARMDPPPAPAPTIAADTTRLDDSPAPPPPPATIDGTAAATGHPPRIEAEVAAPTPEPTLLERVLAEAAPPNAAPTPPPIVEPPKVEPPPRVAATIAPLPAPPPTIPAVSERDNPPPPPADAAPVQTSAAAAPADAVVARIVPPEPATPVETEPSLETAMAPAAVTAPPPIEAPLPPAARPVEASPPSPNEVEPPPEPEPWHNADPAELTPYADPAGVRAAESAEFADVPDTAELTKPEVASPPADFELASVLLAADQLGIATPTAITLLARLKQSGQITLDASQSGLYRPGGARIAPWTGLAYDEADDGGTGIAAGTRILTSRGEVEVEQLLPGDAAMTLRAPALMPIHWIGKSSATAAPILIEAGALGPDLPRRVLCLAPNQAVHLHADPVPASQLVNGTTIRRLDHVEVDFFHVDVGRSEILFAEGLPVSSSAPSDLGAAS